MKVVRWLGAYGRSKTLAQSLLIELTRPEADEVAAEPIEGVSKIKHARVGLLVKRSAILRVWSGDCWSVRQGGRLVATRKPTGSYREAWANPVYVAIVVDGWENLSPSAKRTVRWAGNLFSLRVLDSQKNFREVVM